MPAGTFPDTDVAKPPVALTIAGFDPSSGAGITADLQVFAAHGLFGTACITSLTVQSTQGVASVEPVSHLIGPTLDHLNDDLPPVGIKIGMLGSAEAIRAVAVYLRRIRRTRSGPACPVVLDPITFSSSGRSLLTADGLIALKEELLPLVDWVTPNLVELDTISDFPILLPYEVDIERAFQALHRRYPKLHVVATGGDRGGDTCTDILMLPDLEYHRFTIDRVPTTSTHGTGCAFSSALLSRLVLGDTPVAAVAAAKAYVTEALKRAPGLGKGRGPLNLLWPLTDPPPTDSLTNRHYRR